MLCRCTPITGGPPSDPILASLVRSQARIPLHKLSRNYTCRGDVSGFQTIATCRDGFKNFRYKSATSRFASRKRGSQRRRGQINWEVAGLSRTSRGSRHNGIWASWRCSKLDATVLYAEDFCKFYTRQVNALKLTDVMYSTFMCLSVCLSVCVSVSVRKWLTSNEDQMHSKLRTSDLARTFPGTVRTVTFL